MSARGALGIVGSAALAVFLASAFTSLPNALNRLLAEQPDVGAADAVVVLGGGMHPNGVLTERSIAHAVHGIVLFRQGWAPRLVLLGRAVRLGTSEAGARLALATRLGIPASAIDVLEQARTTREEALAVAALLHGARRPVVLLVSDSRHLRRACLAFAKAGLVARPAPPPDFLAGAASPQERLQLMRRVLEEGFALLYYRLASFG